MKKIEVEIIDKLKKTTDDLQKIEIINKNIDDIDNFFSKLKTYDIKVYYDLQKILIFPKLKNNGITSLILVIILCLLSLFHQTISLGETIEGVILTGTFLTVCNTIWIFLKFIYYKLKSS